MAGLVSGCDRFVPSISDVVLVQNSNEQVPLALICRFRTDVPTRTTVRLSDGTNSNRVPAVSGFRTEHEVVILGLRPNRSHTITITVVDEEGHTGESQPLEWKTEPLPKQVPSLKVPVSRPELMEPGVTLLPCNRWPYKGELDRSFGLILAVDAKGEIVWYYEADHPITEVKRLDNGHILYHYGRHGNMVEIDMLGNTIRQWHTTKIPKEVPLGSIPVSAETIHHDAMQLPSGNFLALSTEIRHFENYPSSEMDPEAPNEPAFVVGDVLLEFAPDGTVVRERSLFDILDPFRLGYDSLDTGFWQDIYMDSGLLKERPKDWSHANSIDYNPADDSLLVSVYHQDTVFKIDYTTGELKWIMSFPTGWGPSWQPYLLTPTGEGLYPCHQHSGKVTPKGTVIMFDNGTYRARPFDMKRAAEDNFSRAVEYEINEETMEFAQVWSYGGPEDEIFFSPILGETDWLPETENILITDGARIRRPDGTPGGHPMQGHKWARVLEVTHTTPAEKVFEVILDDLTWGWTIYRSERIPSLYRDGAE